MPCLSHLELIVVQQPVSTNSEQERGQLSWRIPVEDVTQGFRTALLPLLLFAAVLSGLFLLFSPLENRALQLMAVLPLLAVLLLFYWRSHRRSQQAGGDNVSIDDEGIHWDDDFQRRHSFLRKQIERFSISLDADTQRNVPALILQLEDGFESQPIELYAPATPAVVRQLLSRDWQLPEQTLASSKAEATRIYDALSAAIEHWPSTPEKRLLKRSLCQPTKHANHSWLVCDLAEQGQVTYEAADCSFRWSAVSSGEVVALPDIEALLDHVRNQTPAVDPQVSEAILTHMNWGTLEGFDKLHRRKLANFLACQLASELVGLPASVEIEFTTYRTFDLDFAGLVSDDHQSWHLTGEANWVEEESCFEGYIEIHSEQQLLQEREAKQRDIQQAGFLSQVDEAQQVWKLEGSRSALNTLCNQIESAGETLQVAPFGARPREMRIGGETMYLVVQTAYHAWITENTLCGSPEQLRLLTESLRAALDSAEIDTPTPISVAWGGNRHWVFLLLVREEGHVFSSEQSG